MSSKLLTTNVTLNRPLTHQGTHEERIEIPAFGNGNCAFNALSLGLAALIRTGQLSIDSKKAKIWFAAITRKNRIQELGNLIETYLDPGHPYHILIPHIKDFIKLVTSNPLPTAKQLVDYIINQTSREQLAALQVCLAPSLRQLAYDIGVKKNGDKLNESQFDGVDATEEDIYNVSQFLGLHTRVYVQNPVRRNTFDCSPALRMMNKDIHNAVRHRPVDIEILQTGGHFNLLVSQELVQADKNGFLKLPKNYQQNTQPTPSTDVHDINVNDQAASVKGIMENVSQCLTLEGSKKQQMEFDHAFAQAISDAQGTQCELDDQTLLQEAFITTLEKGLQQNANVKLAKAMETLGIFKVARLSPATPTPAEPAPINNSKT